MKIYRLLLICPLLVSVCFAATSPDPGNNSTGSTGLPENIIRTKKFRLAIQPRIDEAEDGDTILVAPGTYFEHINFMGKAICLKSTDGPEVTVIDGGGVGSVVRFISQEDTTSILDGFTVRNGTGSNHGTWMRGGGIYLENSGAMIRNCLITDNVVGDPIDKLGGGGGGYFLDGVIVIENCTITLNEAGYCGGLNIWECTGRITGSAFYENKAFGSDNHWGGGGGALEIVQSSNFICESNYFQGNLAIRPNSTSTAGRGGAIMIYGCSPVVKHNIFYRNEALYGGAISVVAGSLTRPIIHNNIFLENFAGDEWGKGVGGAIYDWGTYGNAQALIYNNVFDGNGALDFGGENGCGGAVAHAGRGGDIANNIVINTFSGRGFNIPESCDHHHNCFWNNADGDVLYPGEGTIFVDPEVSRSRKYLLPEGSPCIDAGFDPGLGYYRHGAAYDIGAFEFCGDPPRRSWFDNISPRIAVSDSIFLKGGLFGGGNPADTLLAWNFGGHDLEYAFDVFSGEWLYLKGPVEGVLSPGDTMAILLNYETDGLEVGSYYDTLSLASSDPWQPVLEIPVSLHIFTHGVIRVPGLMPTIQSAIDISINGDTILVAPGAFTGPGNRDIDFLGRAITVMSEYPHTETVIDCEGLGRGFIFESGETPNSRLKGFVIRNGFDGNLGGGIYCAQASPLVTGCTMENCEASSSGGGIHCKWSGLLLENCLVTGCSARYGGGVRVYYGALDGAGCTIVDNTAESKGGGLYSSASDMNLVNSIIHGNTAASIEYSGDAPALTFSNIEGGWPGQGNIDLPPMFAGGGDYTLLEGSPCIDAGDPSFPNIPWGGARRDMGAFEFDQSWYLDQNGNIIRKPELLPVSSAPTR